MRRREAWSSSRHGWTEGALFRLGHGRQATEYTEYTDLSFRAVRVFRGLFHEQHLAVGRQRPQVVRHDRLECIAGLTQRVHPGDDLVAEVFRVLHRVAVALVLEQFLELVDARLDLVDVL